MSVEETFDRLLEELVFCEVVVPVKKEWHQSRSICPICQNLCRSFVSKPNLDIYGNKPDPNCQKTYECPNCRRKFPAMRYAQHLEKCLGISSRSRRGNTGNNLYLRDRAATVAINSAAGAGVSGQPGYRAGTDDGDEDEQMGGDDQESNSSDTSYRQRGRAATSGRRQQQSKGKQKRKTGEMVTGMNLDQFTNFDRRVITTPDMAPQHRDAADEYGPDDI